ncbi:MAG: DUF438 domain-containing protein [Clostridiaceae bacterium]|nr:DUF438 domain-containing protein [Clostridiaceae bacterium]
MNDRIEALAKHLRDLIDGSPLEQVRHTFQTGFGDVSVLELAQAENLLVARGVTVEEIQRASALHTDLVLGHLAAGAAVRPDQADGHPARVIAGENEGLLAFLEQRLKPDLAACLATGSEKDRLNLQDAVTEFSALGKHYDRKENLFFPYLERAGLTAPAKVMWGVDQIIRELMKLLDGAISERPLQPKRIRLIADRLLTQVERMVRQENEILMPMLFGCMTEADWILAAQESAQIGLVFNKGIAGASNSDAAVWLEKQSGSIKQSAPGEEGKISLPSGRLTSAQLTAMLNTLPTDLTFIDRDDVVQYYSEGKHQVFARTRTIIGRNVFLCHPPQLVPRIRQLIEAFRTGKKDQAIVPVRKGSRLDLVRYYAVRDESGAYLGTVEVTEEISGIIDLVTGK